MCVKVIVVVVCVTLATYIHEMADMKNAKRFRSALKKNQAIQLAIVRLASVPLASIVCMM